MRWSKIKNIILLLLILVNACLLSVEGMRTANTVRLEKETRTRMISVLERSGVEFLPEKVPGGLELDGYQAVLSQPTLEQAVLLVGDISEQIQTGDTTSYHGAFGGVTFTGTSVEAWLLPDTVPLGGEDAAKSGRKLLESLGLEVSEPTVRKLSRGLELTYVQLWEGQPISDMALTLTYLDGCLRRVSGHWMCGSVIPLSGGKRTLDAATALARFLEARNQEGYIISQIRNICPGYFLTQDTPVTLRPVWILETDTWPWQISVDGWTGEVRESQFAEKILAKT